MKPSAAGLGPSTPAGPARVGPHQCERTPRGARGRRGGPPRRESCRGTARWLPRVPGARGCPGCPAHAGAQDAAPQARRRRGARRGRRRGRPPAGGSGGGRSRRARTCRASARMTSSVTRQEDPRGTATTESIGRGDAPERTRPRRRARAAPRRPSCAPPAGHRTRPRPAGSHRLVAGRSGCRSAGGGAHRHRTLPRRRPHTSRRAMTATWSDSVTSVVTDAARPGPRTSSTLRRGPSVPGSC